jgi:transcriptional regulator of NAD metabolism
MTNVNEEIQNVNVTISVPVKDIAGLVAINYEDLASKVYSEFDLSSIASDVVDEMDSDDLIEKIDMDDLARSFKDQIDISDYIDEEQISANAADMISVEDKISDLLSTYDPVNGCALANEASKAMINAIRYDIMSHLYGQDKSKLDVTITDVLRRFIQQEIARGRKTYTFDEIANVLDSISELDSNIKFKIRTTLTTMMYKENVPSEEIIIKAD